MPELPEVETVRRGLEPHLRGRRIRQVAVRDARLRWPVPDDLARKAEGRRIDSIARRGKYLIVTLDSDDRMIWHLGMSGRMFVLDAAHPLVKHDHVDFVLDSGKLVRFHDTRRFGAVLWWPADEDRSEEHTSELQSIMRNSYSVFCLKNNKKK